MTALCRPAPRGSNRPILSFGAIVAVIVYSSLLTFPTALQAASRQQEAKPESKQQASGAKEAPSAAAPRVSVGEITGSPGASLMIPLYYIPDPKFPLRALTVVIDYVSNHLKFQKAAPGVVAEQGNADVAATVTEGTPDAKGVKRSELRVSVSLMDKEPKKGIPEGLLAYLLFQVSMDAQPFVIRLNTSVVSAEDTRNPPQKGTKVNTVPGMVIIELPDVIPKATCFFFSH